MECAGGWTEARALLFCIYSLLPPYLRRSLATTSSANAPNLKKNLIFSPDARQKDRYLIPRTGENNLLTPRMERKIAHYGYIDHAARLDTLEETSLFFQRLEALAGRFGDASASNEPILRLACPFAVHEENIAAFTDEELENAIALSQRREELEAVSAVLRAEQRRRKCPPF